MEYLVGSEWAVIQTPHPSLSKEVCGYDKGHCKLYTCRHEVIGCLVCTVSVCVCVGSERTDVWNICSWSSDV